MRLYHEIIPVSLSFIVLSPGNGLCNMVVVLIFIQGASQLCHTHNNQPLPLLVLKVESVQLWSSQVKKRLSMLKKKHSDCFKPYVQLHQCDTLSEVNTMLLNMLLQSWSSSASLVFCFRRPIWRHSRHLCQIMQPRQSCTGMQQMCKTKATETSFRNAD